MNKILPIYKPLTFTPNQIIEHLREQFPEYKDEKIGFAGRLDPMAHGVLLLTIGDANKERQQYLNLDKTYQFKAILGLETDTYDLLGLLKKPDYQNPPKNYLSVIKQYCNKTIGKFTQPYPPFSTKPVKGKELFKWAREDRLNEIEIPTKDVEIYDFKLLEQSTITIDELKKHLEQTIPKVTGFFRQDQILKKWSDFYHKKHSDSHTKKLQIITFEVSCSSGTYVRSLVHNLGQELGCGAVTFEIYRPKVGEFTIDDCLKLALP